MDEPTEVGIERPRSLRFPGKSDFLHEFFDLFKKLFFLHHPVVACINPDTPDMTQTRMEQPIYQILDIVETLTSLADEELGFIGKDLEGDNVALLLAINFDHKSQQPEEAVQNLRCHLANVRRLIHGETIYQSPVCDNRKACGIVQGEKEKGETRIAALAALLTF